MKVVSRLLLILIFFLSSDIFSSITFGVHGNIERTYSVSSNWSAYGIGGIIDLDISEQLFLEGYFDYLNHDAPYPFLSSIYGEVSTMKTYHTGARLGLRLLEIFYVKGGIGIMFNDTVTPMYTEKSNYFEANGNAGFIIPLAFLGLKIEGSYRRIITTGDSANFWGGNLGFILKI